MPRRRVIVALMLVLVAACAPPEKSHQLSPPVRPLPTTTFGDQGITCYDISGYPYHAEKCV